MIRVGRYKLSNDVSAHRVAHNVRTANAEEICGLGDFASRWFVLNTRRRNDSSYMVLHAASYRTISPARYWIARGALTEMEYKKGPRRAG